MCQVHGVDTTAISGPYKRTQGQDCTQVSGLSPVLPFSHNRILFELVFMGSKHLEGTGP